MVLPHARRMSPVVPRRRVGSPGPRRWASGAFVVLVALIAACAAPSSAALVAATCDGTLVSGSPGTVSAAAIVEVSGMAASRRHPGLLWVHNDSGDAARVFALSSTGVLLQTLAVTGATARDWEDLAIGPGPDATTSYLYIGDIGDNATSRTSIVVYRVPEPAVDPTAPPAGTGTAAGAQRLTFTYPDGAHNAETLLVDADGSIYVVTKEPSGVAGIYRGPPGLADGSTTVLTAVGVVDLGGLAVGGDIAPGGDAVALRTYDEVFLWPRGAGSTIAAALAGTPCAGALADEPQGETVAFAADGRGYLTMSEGSNQPIHTYRVP